GAPATVASDVYGLGRLMETLLAPLPARAAEWRAIVARATAAAPGERYASVDAFASDLERLRRHEPLAARPALPAYRLRKFLRRRWPVVAAGVGVMALSAVFTASLVHERDAARREAERTRQVSDFVVGLFEGANPNVGGRVDLPVATLVDRGRDRLDANLADQPDLQSAIKGVLGRVYDKVGRPKDSVTQYRQALAAARRRTPRDPLEEATLLSAMSVVLTNEVAIKAGLEAARESLALRRTHAAPDSLAVADALNSLGLALSADRQLEAARLALLETLSIRSQQLGPENIDVASVLHNLGLLAARDERVADAESLLARALVIKQRTLPPTNGSYMNTERELAKLRIVTARNNEAIASLASLAERARAMAGPDSEMLGANLHEWGFALLEAGRTADAITVLAETLAVRQRAGSGPTRQALTINMLAGAQEQLGDPRAEASYRESLALRRQAAAPGQPSASVARGEENYARWLMRQGRAAEALPLLVSAQAARVHLHPGGHGDRRQSELLLAEARLLLGDVAGARALWAPYASAALPPAAIARVLRLEAILLAAEGRPAESHERWDAALAQAQRGMDARGLPANHPDRLRWAQEHAAGTAAVSRRSLGLARTGR
ncbi:MAG: tetratricopeptide repeat protein, partial [Rhodoferax sp.]|nr:tetratricopeptide repeat protein [Rhodoferax sp.]